MNSREAFATHFDTLKFDVSVEGIGNDETIVPTALAEFHTELSAIQTLPRLTVRGTGDSGLHPDLELIGTLGEGGMGLVRLANQVPLQRNVAVKTLRDTTHERAAESLLKEAYITGHLEHPNVVPIYTLGRDDDGAPLIVMKRIEGSVWLDEIERDHAAGELQLERHLEILEQVCSAVRFAHGRKIVHRDIKPENVMIGPYDEVYLLDWGIAISLDDDHKLLPTRAAMGVAGTPSYMAPEMTADDASDVDERTDVYLLGATLHQILTGRPRHEGESVFEAMFSAVRSEPFEYPANVPDALAEIANRACAKLPEDRFQTATEFRDAIDAWLDHRGSIEVSDEALRSLAALEELLELERTPEVELQIHDLSGECRFGFRQAQRMWSGNEAASDGERRFLEVMFEFYLATDQPIAARATLAELPKAERTQLEPKVRALEEELEENRRKVNKLEKMADDLDLRTAATSRSRLAVLLGVLWSISNGYAAQTIHQVPPLPNSELLMTNFESAIRSILIVIVSVFLFRKRIFANLANRRMMYILFGVMASMVLMRGLFFVTEAPYISAHCAELTLYAFTIFVIGITVDLRICWLALGFVLPALLGAWYPDRALWILLPFNLAVFLGMGWIWSPKQMKKRITIEKA